MILELELSFNMNVQSLHKRNFDLYINALNQLVPCGYLFWVMIMYILHDGYQCMVALKPCIFQCLMNFKMDIIVQRSMHKFYRLTLDHSQVQSNKCIKGEGVIVGLKEDWPI